MVERELPATVSAEDVIARLKAAYRVRSDRQLAADLRVSTSTLASWKSRNSIPLELIVEQALLLNLSLDYLILGRGTESKPADLDVEALQIAIDRAIARNVGGSMPVQAELASLIYSELIDMRDKYIKVFGLTREATYKEIKRLFKAGE